MHILALGLNHKTASVEIREKVAFTPQEAPAALRRLKEYDTVFEGVILSTCNRTEVYAVVGGTAPGRQELLEFLGQARSPDGQTLDRHLYHYADEEAVEHLFRVACGLDSMIVGETQVLGQIKEAYLIAQDEDSVGKILHALFSQALATGKRAHTETAISKNATSVSYAAVELARKVFANLAGRRVMVIGAGKMSRLTARHLQAQGARKIVVANRHLERARELAAEFGGEAITLDQVTAELGRCDLVISSTGSPELIIDRALVAEVMRVRRRQPLFMVDIAVPRDIDPRAQEIDNVFLYDIDDLEAVVQANLREREREARLVERIIAEEVRKFRGWLCGLDVVPLIKSLRQKAETIRVSELERAFNKLQDLTPEERSVIDRMSSLIVNKILNDPTWRIKQLAGTENGGLYVETLSRLFNLEPEDSRPDDRREGEPGATGVEQGTVRVATGTKACD